MAPAYRHVTDAELAVLELLWNKPGATTRALTEALYPEGGVAQYYTVQKLLERLEEKGCVERDRSRRTHRFRATLNRDELIGERLQELTDKLCEGSLAPLLTSLFNLRKLTADEFAALKKLVRELDAETKKPPKG